MGLLRDVVEPIVHSVYEGYLIAVLGLYICN